jgi:hypothetical protein
LTVLAELACAETPMPAKLSHPELGTRLSMATRSPARGGIFQLAYQNNPVTPAFSDVTTPPPTRTDQAGQAAGQILRPAHPQPVSELRMRRYTKPEQIHRLLLDRLGFDLPGQPPPEIKNPVPVVETF